MSKEEIKLKISADIKSAQESLREVKQETNDLKDSIGFMGMTWGSVKQSFTTFKTIAVKGLKAVRIQAKLAGLGIRQMFSGGVIKGAKTLFTVIKAGIVSTGFGVLLIAFAALIQYFTDSEKGASKLKQIMAGVGVVIGNVTDIVSDYGKMWFSLLTLDFAGFKESINDMAEGISNFGDNTRKEMAMAIQLEKDRLALQIFEREAMVKKAETEKEMMKLRLEARDVEKFTTEERLEFMREANQLAEEQLALDLHVAEERLRHQIEENSYSKSTQENLEAEANLRAEVFRIQKANFSERKRMKSEEQALANEQAAALRARQQKHQAELNEIRKANNKLKQEANNRNQELYIRGLKSQQEQEEHILFTAFKKEEERIEDSKLNEEDKFKALTSLATTFALDKQDIEDKFQKLKDEKDKAAADVLRNLQDQNMLNNINNLTERALAELDIQKQNELDSVRSHENFEQLKLEIDQKYAKKRNKVRSDEAKLSKVTEQMKLQAMTNGIAAAQSLAGEHKGLAIAQATIDTYSAVTGALADKTVPSSALRFANAAAMGVMGIANVKKILSTQSGDGGGGGGATPNVESQAPSQQFSSGAFELSGGSTAEPVQAFVVSDDMTSSQDKLASIRRRATI